MWIVDEASELRQRIGVRFERLSHGSLRYPVYPEIESEAVKDRAYLELVWAV